MRVLKVIAIIVVAAAVLVGGIFALVGSLTADDKTVAENFLNSLAEPDLEATNRFVHPAGHETEPFQAELQRLSGRLEPFTAYSWTSASTSTDEGVKLEGTAVTASGCESKVTAGTVDDAEGNPKIIAFTMEPPCPKATQ